MGEEGAEEAEGCGRGEVLATRIKIMDLVYFLTET